MKIRPANDAFSLVEIAIVMVIIGLLAGGIMIGSNMIQRAELNKVTTGLTKYGTAFLKFKEQYQALPGDYVDATEQWGTDAVTGGCATPAPIAADRVAKKETCNGNGNNEIASPETFRAWQHLSNAGLIEGMYTGVADSSGTSGVTGGENTAAGPFTNTAYTIATTVALTGNADYYDQPLTHQVTFGGQVANDWAYGPALTPKDQYGIDLKIDDGKPSTGYVRSLKSPRNPNCTTSDVDATAEYAVTNNNRNCALLHFIKAS